MLKIGGLYIVGDPGVQPKFRCCVPGCDAAFFEHQMSKWEQHVVACSNRNHEQVVAQSVRNRDPSLFDPNSPEYNGDADLSRWVRKHRVALIEERMRM